ncbi:MAG: tetratricopeptide repeat protein [Candidatus Koribacter versatilis]|nr:tetratricopeptide repeat protein [Candidatus Koribacter versatilis]
MGRNPDARVTTDMGREICLRDGIKAMLTGSIDRLGSQYAITLEAIQASTGETLDRQQVQAERKEDVLNALHRAATRLRGQLGESLASVQKFDMPLSQATTSSLEALKALSMGDARHSLGDELGAVPLYQRAVELDPNFAMAYARLGAVYNNLQQTQLSEMNRQKAFELRDRASEREKLYITSHYYADSGQLDKGMTALELYRQTYPRDPIPYVNLANIYDQLGQFDNALASARQALDLDPDQIASYENLAAAYVGLKRTDEARATLNAALQRKLGGSSVYVFLASLDWAEGNEAAMEKNLQQGSATPEGELMVLGFRANLAAARGQLRHALEFTRKAQDGLGRLHLQGREDLDARCANFHALIGKRAEAVNAANAALRTSRTFSVLWNSALAFAAAGQEQNALSLADEIQRTRPNDTIAQNVAVPVTRAVASLMSSSPAKAAPEKALDQLNKAAVYVPANNGVLFARAVAYKQAGRYPEALEDLQKVQDLRPFGPDVLATVALLETGRVYTGQGNLPKARIAYQNFLAAWKDADPDVPLLRTAKAEYAKLQ